MNPKSKRLPNGHWVGLDEFGNIISAQFPTQEQAEHQGLLTNFASRQMQVQAPQDEGEVIDMDELHRRALGRANEVPDLLQQTGYNDLTTQTAQQTIQRASQPRQGQASVNFAIPKSVLEGADQSANTFAPQSDKLDRPFNPNVARPEAPSGFINAYRQDMQDEPMRFPVYPTHATGTPPMATSPAEYRAHQKQAQGYDQDGYYVGTPREGLQEINRAERAIQLQQPDEDTRKHVQASVDANQIKSPEPYKEVGMFETDKNPDPWEGVHKMGDTDGDFLDEISKTFKLTSDPAAKTDLSRRSGEAKSGARPPKKRDLDEDARVEFDMAQRGMIGERDKKLYSPGALKTDISLRTPVNLNPQQLESWRQQNWNQAQWSAFNAQSTPEQNQAKYNQGQKDAYAQSVNPRPEPNGPYAQWKKFNDTSGPAPGQNIQEWAMQRLQQNGGFGEAYQDSPQPTGSGSRYGQPGQQWVGNGQGKIYIDQYGRERNAQQHNSDMAALEGGAGNQYIPGRGAPQIVEGQSGSLESRQQAQREGEDYYRKQRYGNRGWDLGDMLHGATGGLVGDKMKGPAAGQSEQDWRAQQDEIARQNMYSDPQAKGEVHNGPNEVDGFLDSLAKSYATYRYKDPQNEPTEQPTGDRYMGVMADKVAASPTGDTLVKKDERGLEYLDEKPNLSAALAALGRLHERILQLEGRGRKV